MENSDRMKDIKESFKRQIETCKQREEGINEHFKHYRNTAIALSVTLISLSSALIIWEDSSKSLKIISAITILICVWIQIFHYVGYMLYARKKIQQPIEDDKLFCLILNIIGFIVTKLKFIFKGLKNPRDPNFWFTLGDRAFFMSINFFMISILFAIWTIYHLK